MRRGARRGKQPGRHRGRGVEGVAAGLRWGVWFWGECLYIRWCACSPRQPSDSEGACSGGVGYVMGKSMTFCLIFEEVKHTSLPPLFPAASPRSPLHKEKTQINQALVWSAFCFLQPSVFSSPRRWSVESQDVSLENLLNQKTNSVMWLLQRWCV